MPARRHSVHGCSLQQLLHVRQLAGVGCESASHFPCLENACMQAWLAGSHRLLLQWGPVRATEQQQGLLCVKVVASELHYMVVCQDACYGAACVTVRIAHWRLGLWRLFCITCMEVVCTYGSLMHSEAFVHLVYTRPCT
jgi:hypothetical protein